MFHFWSTFIGPIINAVAPKIIVEIGAESGHNTVNIVAYCRQNGAKCYIIDPLPIKRMPEIKEDFKLCGQYFPKLSLEVLPGLAPADVYLIDGDHNWYTVFFELKQIYNKHKNQKVPLPLIFFHDVGWPYARRDLYYDPKTIPTQYLQPYAKIGIYPGQKKAMIGGINSHLHNALEEGGPQNGVLTAVEDFLKLTCQIYNFEKIPGVHGLGVLIPRDLEKEKQQEIEKILNDSTRLKHQLEDVEEMRVYLNRDIHQQHVKSELEKNHLTNRLGAKEQQIVHLGKQQRNNEKEVRELRAWQAGQQEYVSRLRRFLPTRLAIGFFDRAIKIRRFLIKIRRFYQSGFLNLFYAGIFFMIGRSRIYSDNSHYNTFLILDKWRSRKIDKKNSQRLDYQPLISIIVPVFDTPARYLRKCILSVVNQTYKNWELCIYDDASTKSETLQELLSWKNKDPRINIRFGRKNLHISGASNQAIKMSSGEFVGLLDHDDELVRDALLEVVKKLNKDKKLDFIYSDEDKLELNNKRSDHNFKPDFNLDYLLSICYIAHFTVIRRSLGDRVGWFRRGYEGAQDHDLFIRLAEQTKRIGHIAKVLYHWRKLPGSTAAINKSKAYCVRSSTKTLIDYVDRNKIKGTVQVMNTEGVATYRIKRAPLKEELISIIVPFKDKVNYLKTCVYSILEKTAYKKFEILLVSNNSKNNETFDFLHSISSLHDNVRFFEYNVPFNFSKINNWAVNRARGEIVLFLNNDTEIIDQEWLGEMLSHIQRSRIGAVGAKLLYPNDTVQHGGVIMGIGGVAGHAHKNFPDNSAGYASRLQVVQEMSGVTGACLMTRKKIHQEIGGFNEKELAIAFNDVDYCLKIRSGGYKIIYTPFAKLYHHESISRGYEDTKEKQKRFAKEVAYIQNKWGKEINADPNYNPNLTLEAEDFSLKKSYEFFKKRSQ